MKNIFFFIGTSEGNRLTKRGEKKSRNCFNLSVFDWMKADLNKSLQSIIKKRAGFKWTE